MYKQGQLLGLAAQDDVHSYQRWHVFESFMSINDGMCMGGSPSPLGEVPIPITSPCLFQSLPHLSLPLFSHPKEPSSEQTK